jgi:hypothetical protein
VHEESTVIQEISFYYEILKVSRHLPWDGGKKVPPLRFIVDSS